MKDPKFKIGDKVIDKDEGTIYTIISKLDLHDDYIGYTEYAIGDSYKSMKEYYGSDDEGLIFSEIQFPKNKDDYTYNFTISDSIFELAHKDIANTKIARKVYPEAELLENGKLRIHL